MRPNQFLHSFSVDSPAPSLTSAASGESNKADTLQIAFISLHTERTERSVRSVCHLSDLEHIFMSLSLSPPLSLPKLKILQIYSLINSPDPAVLNQICRCVKHLTPISYFLFLSQVWKVKLNLSTFMFIFISASDCGVLEKFQYVISPIIMSSLHRCSPATTTSPVQ